MNFEISSQDLVLQRRSSVLLDEALCPAISTFTLQDHVEVIHHSREEFYEMVSKEVLNREKCSAACLTVNKIATQLKENVPWRTQTTTPITKKSKTKTRIFCSLTVDTNASRRLRFFLMQRLRPWQKFGKYPWWGS